MAYVGWFVARARDKSNHVPALQAYWQRTMALRNNKSSGAAAKEIMDDVALWQEVLRRLRPSALRRRSTGWTAPRRP